MEIISCKNLSFSFGKKIILENINIEVNMPKIIALVGENGVGKTTFLKLLTGFLLPGKGNIYNSGKLADLIHINSFYPALSIYDNLEYFSYIYNINKENINSIISLCKINEYKDMKYKRCSDGTKMKVAIAKCLMQDADIYIFDEPFNTLDPSYIIYLKKLLLHLKNMGKSIIISSHILRELDDLVDEVWHLNNCKIDIYDVKKIVNIESLFGDKYELL